MASDERLSLRFWAKVKKTRTCWYWTAAQFPAGYGRFRLGTKPSGNGKYVSAHRFAFEELVGPIPTGLVLDHLCRRVTCVNPAHLEPVTIGENVTRGENPAAKNKRSEQCIYGHAFDEENTYVDRRGRRHCRECRRRRNRESYRRSRAASSAK